MFDNAPGRSIQFPNRRRLEHQGQNRFNSLDSGISLVTEHEFDRYTLKFAFIAELVHHLLPGS
jgi:hypothetical protein